MALDRAHRRQPGGEGGKVAPTKITPVYILVMTKITSSYKLTTSMKVIPDILIAVVLLSHAACADHTRTYTPAPPPDGWVQVAGRNPGFAD